MGPQSSMRGQALGAAWRRPLQLLLVLLLTMAASLGRAEADVAHGSEISLKAAYLFKFAQYVEWPPDTFATNATPLTFAILGDDELAGELTRISAGQTINEHAVTVRVIKAGDPITGVHVLFVNLPGVDRLRQFLTDSRPQLTLTVTDMQGALDAGSAINFVRVGDHIRFEASIGAAQRSGIKLNSRLLSVAQRVKDKVP